jgi:hypothetical protein
MTEISKSTDDTRPLPLAVERFILHWGDMGSQVRRIAAGRKTREIDPALAALRACVAEAERDASVNPVAARRLKEMLEFTQTVDRWFQQMLTIPQPKLAALMKLGAKVISLLPAGKAK